MTRAILHIDRSARDRLTQIARREGLNANVVFTRYFQERLLARLGMSPYREHLILKGGLFLFATAIVSEQRLARPTRDMDLSAKGLSNSPESLGSAFAEIGRIEVHDGVHFDHDAMKIEVINPQKKYPGVRMRIPASLAGIKTYIQVDIAFGDVITPAPERLAFPVLLDDMSVPDVLTYSVESTMAEKFHAMIFLSIATGRFRDFYDIHSLAQRAPLSGSRLSAATRDTFRARNTTFDSDPVIFRDVYLSDPGLMAGW